MGRCLFSTHKLSLYPTSLAGPVSIGASSNSAVESTLGGVLAPFAYDLLRFGISFSLCLVPFHSSWEFSSSTETFVVAHFGLSARWCWSLYSDTVRTRMWRLNKSPYNSGNNVQ